MVETPAALGDEPDLTLAAISPTSDSELLIIPGYLGENDYPVNILIDGGACGNFISEEIAQAAQITLDSTHRPSPLLMDRTTVDTLCQMSLSTYPATMTRLISSQPPLSTMQH